MGEFTPSLGPQLLPFSNLATRMHQRGSATTIFVYHHHHHLPVFESEMVVIVNGIWSFWVLEDYHRHGRAAAVECWLQAHSGVGSNLCLG